MDEDRVIRIEGFLESIGRDAASTPPSIVSRLHLIDDAVRARRAKTAEARSLLREGRITVLGISEDTGIPRKSIYNNPELRTYIERCSQEDGELAVVRQSELDNLRQRVDALSRRVEKMALRDVREQELASEVERLQRDVAARDRKVAQLEKDLARAKGQAGPKVVSFSER